MSKLLLIVRHGKSSWDSDAPTDFDRPLSPRGEQDAPRMGEWLKAQELIPSRVISSPAMRAAQTATAVCEALGVKKKRIHWDRRIYGADVTNLLQVLAEVPAKEGRVMLVGHNPGLEELVSYLWGERTLMPPDGKLMPTAAVARIELPCEWLELRDGVAQGVSVTRPKDIA